MTKCAAGLHLLAGVGEPLGDEALTGDFPRLFELLLTHYDYVIVDSSSRMDRAVRLLCELSETVLLVTHSDVVSLWSVAKLQAALGESLGSDRFRLVINRFRKIPGFSERDIETTTRVKVISKIPDHYELVASAIDRGIPIAQQNHSEIARAFVALAGVLAQHTEPKKRKIYDQLGYYSDNIDPATAEAYARGGGQPGAGFEGFPGGFPGAQGAGSAGPGGVHFDFGGFDFSLKM